MKAVLGEGARSIGDRGWEDGVTPYWNGLVWRNRILDVELQTIHELDDGDTVKIL